MRLRGLVWGILAFALAGVALAAPSDGHDGLSARLDAAGFFAIGEHPVVSVTISNDSLADLYVLRWQTPLAGVDADLFDVRRDGEQVVYIGRLVKRVAPRPEDYLRIPAGSSRSVAVDLARYYDLGRTGEYSVQLRLTLTDALRDGATVKVATTDVLSNVAILGIERDERASQFAAEASRQPLPVKASNSYVSCSSSRQSSLGTVRTNAASYASGALSYLNGHTYSTAGPRYTTWFGALSSSRYSTVTTHYSNLRTALSNASYTFDCTCTDSGTYAYVYPTQPYRVYLCGAFWSAPSTGTDSKAGTLVHESSHFNVVASTDDWVYGQSACKSLAKSNPSHAIDNADSHEYFAENNPAQN
jgi:peptidyl-Lys metalloendopeptidase